MRAKKLRQHMLAAAVMLAIGSKASMAATYTWAGRYSSDWGNPSSWLNSLTVPGPTDDVLFQGPNTGNDPIIYSKEFVNSLEFDTSSQLTIYSESGTLTLQSGAITRTADSTGNQTISVPVAIGSNTFWNLQGSGSLTMVFGGVTDDGNGYGLTKAGSADLLFYDSANTIGGAITVAQGNLIIQNSAFTTSAQGNDSLLVTNPGSMLSLTSYTTSSLSTVGRPRIDNGGTVSLSSYSSWTNGADRGGLNEIVVGQTGSGALNISNGATVNTGTLTLGGQSVSSGTVLINSAGQLTANTVNAGTNAGSASISIVGYGPNTGPAAALNAQTLNLGLSAPATLLLTQNGHLTLTQDPNNPQTTGILNLGPQATVTVDGGVLNVAGIEGGGSIDLKSDASATSPALVINSPSDSTIQASFTGTGRTFALTGYYSTDHFVNTSYSSSGYMSLQGNFEMTGGTYSTTIYLIGGNLTFDGGVVLQGSTIYNETGLNLIYDNATVNQCALTNFGQQVMNAVFNETTISTALLVFPKGQLTLNNSIVSGGKLTNLGQMSTNGLTVTSTGDLELSSTAANPVSATGLEIDGKMNVNSGSLVNSASDLVLGAGSVSTVKPGAQITLSGTTALSMHGATLFNDGAITGPVNVNFNSVAGGSGQYTGSLNVFTGGRVWPGDGASSAARIASLASTSSVWNDGGIFHWEISSSSGAPGAAWDLWNAGATSITSTGIFDVEIESIGSLPDWDSWTGHSWLIATSDNGAFSSDALSHLAIVDDGFASANDLAGGSLSLTDSTDGANLYLNFTPAPEPTSVACIALCASGLLLGRKGRRV